jgi:hypothetical protein
MQKKVIKTDLGLIQDIESEFQNAFKLYDVQSELIKAQNQVKKAKSDFLSTFRFYRNRRGKHSRSYG